jgi:hypothetical protein
VTDTKHVEPADPLRRGLRCFPRARSGTTCQLPTTRGLTPSASRCRTIRTRRKALAISATLLGESSVAAAYRLDNVALKGVTECRVAGPPS